MIPRLRRAEPLLGTVRGATHQRVPAAACVAFSATARAAPAAQESDAGNLWHSFQSQVSHGSVTQLLVSRAVSIAHPPRQPEEVSAKEPPYPHGGQQRDGHDDAPRINCEKCRCSNCDSDKEANPARDPHLGAAAASRNNQHALDHGLASAPSASNYEPDCQFAHRIRGP